MLGPKTFVGIAYGQAANVDFVADLLLDDIHVLYTCR